MRQIRHFELQVPIFGQILLVDAYWIHCYGQYDALDPTDIYLDPLMALDYTGLFDANTLKKSCLSKSVFEWGPGSLGADLRICDGTPQIDPGSWDRTAIMSMSAIGGAAPGIKAPRPQQSTWLSLCIRL